MKRLFSIFGILCAMLIMPACYAVDVVVESLSEFNTASENESILSVKVLEDAEMESGLKFSKDSTIKSKVLKIQEATRGDRNAYIVIKPISEEKDGVVSLFNDEYLEAKVVGYSKKDWKNTGIKAGTSAGLAVGSHFVPGLSQMFYFAKGLVRPAKDKSRIESAVTSVYENSPFKYFSKGEELDIEEGDMLVLKMYHSNISKWRFRKRQK